ncbi:hypothetical protein TNCV_4435541 [Trichonephila clavipes]|nr:hypothetical protein TNCV_4435541 [Trichonephila clavipes]
MMVTARRNPNTSVRIIATTVRGSRSSVDRVLLHKAQLSSRKKQLNSKSGWKQLNLAEGWEQLNSAPPVTVESAFLINYFQCLGIIPM